MASQALIGWMSQLMRSRIIFLNLLSQAPAHCRGASRCFVGHRNSDQSNPLSHLTCSFTFVHSLTLLVCSSSPSLTTPRTSIHIIDYARTSASTCRTVPSPLILSSTILPWFRLTSLPFLSCVVHAFCGQRSWTETRS